MTLIFNARGTYKKQYYTSLIMFPIARHLWCRIICKNNILNICVFTQNAIYAYIIFYINTIVPLFYMHFKCVNVKNLNFKIVSYFVNISKSLFRFLIVTCKHVK